MPREANIEAESVKALAAKGAIAMKLTCARGVPDRIVLDGDRYFFIEFKTPTGRASAAQRYWQDQLRANVYFAVSVEQAIAALESERGIKYYHA